MNFSIKEMIETILSFSGTVVSTIIMVAIYRTVKWIFKRRLKTESRGKLIVQIILSVIVLFAVFFVALSLPISEGLKGDIISLLGIVLSATFALSSTTILGNALAGIMSRIIGHFRIGDFVRINEYFGRVTNIGLFAMEIQVEDRSLITLPNLYVATHPLKSIRSSGYIVSSEVSLGYDVPRAKITECLKKAALSINLKDPYVYVTALGDFSIVYKVHGMLSEPEKLLTFKSMLNGAVLDALHGAKIEIVSPTFMNQRQVNDQTFIPKKIAVKEEADVLPEDLVFDKAIQAETQEKMDSYVQRLKEIQSEITKKLNNAKTDEEKERQQNRLDLVTKKLHEITAI